MAKNYTPSSGTYPVGYKCLQSIRSINPWTAAYQLLMIATTADYVCYWLSDHWQSNGNRYKTSRYSALGKLRRSRVQSIINFLINKSKSFVFLFLFSDQLFCWNRWNTGFICFWSFDLHSNLTYSYLKRNFCIFLYMFSRCFQLVDMFDFSEDLVVPHVHARLETVPVWKPPDPNFSF